VDSLPYLAGHCLQEMIVLPGSTYVEMALAAATAAYGETPRVLEKIELQQLLFLSETSTRTLHAILSSDDKGETYFHAYSAEQVLGSRTPYVSITIPNKQVLNSQVPDHVACSEIRSRCSEEMSREDLYAEFRENGNQFGPAFQGIERLWLGRGEAIGCLRASAQELKGYYLHPTLLDIASQILVAANSKKSCAFVLVGCDRILLYGPLSLRSWAHARILTPSNTETLIGNVSVLNESGETAIELLGIRCRYLENDSRFITPASASQRTIAITATFTAEPLGDSLSFWMKEFRLPHKIVFAPYNQLFQQLLDPLSLFSMNGNGINVILVRFEDWIKRNDGLVANVDSFQKERLLAGRPRQTLPNHIEIAHLNRYETEYLYEEIFVDQVYLKHGIVLNDGDCVIDGGANIGVFSLFVQQRCKNAHIYAFEPSPPAFEALNINLTLYGSDVRAFNCGLSDKNAEAPFTFYRKSSLFSGFHANSKHDRMAIRTIIRNALQRNISVDTELVDAFADELIEQRLESETYMSRLKTLSSVIEEQQIERIDLLKIDIEKSELLALKGIAEEHWGIIKQIVMEIHDREGELVIEITSLLKEKGFNLVMEKEELLRDSGLYHVYAVRPSNDANVSLRESPASETYDKVERNVHELISALKSLDQRSQTPHLIFLCPASPVAAQSLDQQLLFRQMEQRLGSELDGLSNVRVVRSAELLSAYPVASFYDPHGDQLGHIPYTSSFFTALGTLIARKYQALCRDPYKVVVLDCDQTLWDGFCGEHEAPGIEIDPPRQTLQEFMVGQHEAGMILCLCSKNNEKDVIDVFESHPEMPLKRHHILSWQINWRPKSESIKALAYDLQLGLDSFIFIDDDPIECAEVQALCPEVLTLQLPTEAADIPKFLEHVWAFDHRKVSEEDKQRTRLYQQNKTREDSRQASLTLGSFLRGLGLQIRISEIAPQHLTRVAQLTQRTNQLNFTTIRRSEAQVQQVIQSGTLECLVVEVSDRFGDYGLVGLIFFKSVSEAVAVDTFLLSCRALGKGVEHRMLAKLGEIAAERALIRVDVPFLPSGSNQLALDFLNDVSSEFREPLLNDVLSLPVPWPIDESKKNFVFKIPAILAARFTYDPDAGHSNNNGRLEEGGTRSPKQKARFVPGALVGPKLLGRIAAEMHDVDQILKAVESQQRREKGGKVRGASKTPKSHLERTVAGIWENVLGIDEVGINDKFFEIGGNSLKAVQVIAQLRRAFKVEFPTVAFFDKMTISDIVRLLSPGNSEGGAVENSASRRVRGELRREKNVARLRRLQENFQRDHSIP
jgi:FkbH-like protein/FkbM family methyltransferase